MSNRKDKKSANTVQTSNFPSAEQAELFQTLKQISFNGKLIVSGPRGQKWVFYLHKGYIFYVTGGNHAIRRWKRNLAVNIPHIPTDNSTLQKELAEGTVKDYPISWDYYLLSFWLQQQKINRDQATKMVWSLIVEVLFDINQAMEVNYELKVLDLGTAGFVLVDGEQTVAEAERQWIAWQNAKFGHFSPNGTPLIGQNDQLQQNISPQVYQRLNQLLDGQSTLRDLALKMRRDLVTVTRSLVPYLQIGLVELTNTPDFPAPFIGAILPNDSKQKPLIACVDDSPLICSALQEIIAKAGYRFVGMTEPKRALKIFPALRPDIIFLDLMMPETDGFEVCEKLRRHPVFRSTPIIILTGNDGMVDRVKAKIVRSSDFLSKATVEPTTVLEVIRKHLKHCTLLKATKNQADNSPEGRQISQFSLQ